MNTLSAYSHVEGADVEAWQAMNNNGSIQDFELYVEGGSVFVD